MCVSVTVHSVQPGRRAGVCSWLACVRLPDREVLRFRTRCKIPQMLQRAWQLLEMKLKRKVSVRDKYWYV